MGRFGRVIGFCLGLAMLGGTAARGSDPFPEYELIRPNVAFWVRVYTEFPTTTAVVHDSQDLGIVYGVVDLLPQDDPAAPKTNRRRMKEAKAGYERILERLAADPGVDDPGCRRVAALFGPAAGPETFRRAARNVRAQIGQKDRFREGLVRSGAYIDRIRSIFEAFGLPEDLAYLPHVESSFNVKAYSKYGAAGIWQFTRSTGRRFMTVDYVLDERRDPIAATHAAARLLRENHERLGDWPLAITAYNHGANGMERARRAHGDYPTVYRSYRGRSFKFASRNFYSEFLAARKVASDPAAYFGPLETDRPQPFRTLTLEAYARVEDLCAHFGVPLEVLREMNPALRPPVFDGQKYVPKGYRLHLPAGSGAPLLADFPAVLYRKAQKPSQFYTVQKGDTAGRIARMHGVRLADLILANNLNRRATIYPRQTLRIPQPKTAAPEPVLTAAAGKTTVTEGPAPRAREAAAAPPEGGAAAEAPALGLIVGPTAVSAAPVTGSGGAPSETIPSARPAPLPATPAAAAVHPAGPAGPGAASLVAEAEPGHPSGDGSAPLTVALVVDAGPGAVAESGGEAAAAEGPVASRDLADDGAVGPSTEVVTADVRVEPVAREGRDAMGRLRVEVAETLGHYAEWAGVRTREIRRLNGLPYGRTLHLDQEVLIPLAKVSLDTFEERRYEHHKRIQEDFFAAYRAVEKTPYRVRTGDTVWGLCRERFDIPVWLLQHFNPDADLAALRAGQLLQIPTVEKTDGGDPGTVTDDTESGIGVDASG